MTRKLAIDPGTKCGYALMDGPRRISGVWDLSPRRHEGGGMRFLRLRRYLEEIGRVDEVAYEEVRRHLGVDAAHIYGGVVSEVTAWCEAHGTPYQGVPVGTVKKHATGKGNATKEHMVESARHKLAWDGKDDNEADALWILDWMITQGVPA